MGPSWVLSAPDRPHVGPMNFAIRVGLVKGSVPGSLDVNYRIWIELNNNRCFVMAVRWLASKLRPPGLFQYSIRRLVVRSRVKVLKLRDWWLRLSYRFVRWLVLLLLWLSHISERYGNAKFKVRSFDSLQGQMKRLFWYWAGPPTSNVYDSDVASILMECTLILANQLEKPRYLALAGVW